MNNCTLRVRAIVLATTFGLIGLLAVMAQTAIAQDNSSETAGDVPAGEISAESAGIIILDSRGKQPEPPVFYRGSAKSIARIEPTEMEQSISLQVQVLQGKPKTLSFGLNGEGTVADVQGENLKSWSVRRKGDERFLDLQVDDATETLKVEITMRSVELSLPRQLDLPHLTPGESVGFDSQLTIHYGPGIDARVMEATGFTTLEGERSEVNSSRFQSSTGGKISLALNRDGALPGPVELVETNLTGELHPNGQSMHFEFRGTARVTKANAKVTILSGNAAVSKVPSDSGYRVRLAKRSDGQLVYELVFAKPGDYPLEVDFVAALNGPVEQGQSLDFTIAASTVVPVQLLGLAADLEFQREQESVVPIRTDDIWQGFLPATGRARLQWKAARKAGEGKLFFSTTARVETRVGAGLLRQDHQLEYQVLQGELKTLSIQLHGPGEILDVQGTNIVGWNVTGDDERRELKIVLSQPIVGKTQIVVRSQTPLGAFPLRIEGLRLAPEGAIRHSGYLRLSNLGSVRLEPTSLTGLTQLSPEQFPGEAIEARQNFVYRFPASDYAFTVAADRIQPEVNISQVVLYEVGESDRGISADIEMDIREAPIREWDFSVPGDYSVVSVAGSSVADYVAASELTDGRRNLKVIFSGDVSGRQLVTLQLEKSEPAAAADWQLPQIGFPEAKSVRGDIGIVGAPGFRITTRESDLLVEKPLSYFPKPMPNLQQAFRIRETGWSASVQIELLERNVQSDVFHLYSLSEETVYGSALINYFVTGSPVSEWRIAAPESLGNILVDGRDVRTWRREGDTLIVSLHQAVMGAYTLLITFEEKPDKANNSFQAGLITPLAVQGERGYIQVVSPMQVKMTTASASPDLLKLDPLELPAELRLLSTAPPLGTWQYTRRPFELFLNVEWFQPGTMVAQIVEFSEANSRVSQDGELVTDVTYFVKSRGQRTLKLRLPPEPVRLWEVSVDGQPVTARQANDETLVPLPGGTDPNVPVEVKLRLGKPAVDVDNPALALPIVFAPVLKTQWKVTGDENHILVPNGGTVAPPVPVLRPSGFEWVAKRGIIDLGLISLFTLIGIWCCRRSALLRVLGLLSLAIAIGLSVSTASVALSDTAAPTPLQLSLPILSSGENIELQVTYTPLWRVNLSWVGLAVFLAGIAAIGWSFTTRRDAAEDRALILTLPRFVGILLIAFGVLLQGDGAPWFYAFLGLAILVLLFAPPAIDFVRSVAAWFAGALRRRKKPADAASDSQVEGGPVTAVVLFLALSLAAGNCSAQIPSGFEAADSIVQQWQITAQDARLNAKATLKLSGRPGDRFVLLKAPAVLTQFEGGDLRLVKAELPGEGLAYIVSIPLPDSATAEIDDTTETDAEEQAGEQVRAYQATFEYQLEALRPTDGIRVLTGTAAVQEINLTYDEAGWDVVSQGAMRIESTDDSEATQAKILLGPGPASLVLRPKARDVASEETQFFVEASNLYLPGPGVVDGRHRLNIRTSQGQVTQLNISVPMGLTVSAVNGPVASWQFDAESGGLILEIAPGQPQTFDVMIETQRGLDPLPADVTLAPLRVTGADGEVGLLAIAFGPDAQPEKSVPTQMSGVNLGDFDSSLLANRQAVLHRVFRYGADGGELELRVAPVEAEVRVVSKQVLSLGDERVVLGVNFQADITRAGLFQLSFPLPDGLEVESLSGAALHHWSELVEDGARHIVLHLNGKTIGPQNFSLTLTGPAPADIAEWSVPKFEVKEAARQSGELFVRPTTGIRLRTVSRQNVSEADPRSMNGAAPGSLAFRLLQRDWTLVLGIEKLDPWVTGQVLHEVTLREGQTRFALLCEFNVQNAAIRSLQVELPMTDDDAIQTLRASGSTVSDFVRTAPDSNIWEVQFKRRVVGKIDFRIEYERRGDRSDERESLQPILFPEAKQVAYFLALRAGGRLELEHESLTGGWQDVDWSTVPASLRDSENRSAPVFVLRSLTPVAAVVVIAKRHSLADALKLRVAKGTLTTVLSPTGDQLTAVDVTIEVIQRSSLIVGLPNGGELFSVFVNGESVNSIRQGGEENAWQFTILPGIDDRTASVRFVYSVVGDRLRHLTLTSPELNVPLENIQWSVIAPTGFELIDDDGNLELVSQSNQASYDRDSYLSQVSGRRRSQAQQATRLLEQANQLLQAGEQTKARWALNSVANQYALDAASNEDARVQLENLQTQQAIVGLNTRRQRLFLDNLRDELPVAENQQMRDAAAENPILQQENLNFRPQQLSQLLKGNTTEDNAMLGQIAARLVRHQRTSQPAPQAILISLPEEGHVYTFSRTVQVAENAPLELDLQFDRERRLRNWETGLVLALLSVVAVALAYITSGPWFRKSSGTVSQPAT